MNISYSAVQEWRKCQQAYHYRYVEHLYPKADDAAPTLGRVLHRYLELFYTLTWLANPDPDARHRAAFEMTQDEYGPEVNSMGNAAYAAGYTELAEELFGLIDRASGIADRYYRVRGRDDLTQHTALVAEREITYPLDTGIDTPTRIDLVTRDAAGQVWLWEHKTLRQIPPQTRRMKDLQTLLMAVLAEEALGLKVNGVIWNYLRTKPPTVPTVLKSGLLTTRSDLDSTWETYLREIDRLGQDPLMYDPVRERLAGRELDSYFVRIDLPMYQSERVLLRDFIATARTIKGIYESGAAFVPVRTVGNHCDWCAYSKLCEAVITGGDDADLADRLFTRQKRKEVAVGNSLSTGGDDDWDG